MNVRAMVCGRMTVMPLVDPNIKTVWVEITGKIIKRHRVKHRVEETLDAIGPDAKGLPWYIRLWNWITRIFGEGKES